MSDVARVEVFAQRVLNPFRGVLQVIRFLGAEAVSMDGEHWDLYVRNDSLLDGLDTDGHRVLVSEIRYGKWSAAHGLKRGALYPSEDFYRMERQGEVVYDALRQLHAQVPFPLRDHFERWLLDRAGQPLVLLDSAVDQAGMAEADCDLWRIGLSNETQFTSPALADCPDAGSRSAGRYLMDYINGLGSQVAWFSRGPDGCGRRLDTEQTLPAEAFPRLLLRSQGHDPAHGRLVADFIDGQAPWQLLLSDLDPATRARMEHLARHQASAVARLFRLYPVVIDADQINAARVEARLDQALAQGPGVPDSDLSTFYIELDTPGAV